MKAEPRDGRSVESVSALAAEGVLRVPAPPGEQRSVAFPFIMAIAPIFVALLLWLLLSSPAMLVFALLGPVMAVASHAEARRQARSEWKRASARFTREFADCLDQALALGEADLERLRLLVPAARHGLSESRSLDGPLCLGYGSVRVRVSIQGELLALPEDARARLEQLLTHQEAPIVSECARIRITGSTRLMLAAGRGLILQRIEASSVVALGRGPVASALARELEETGAAWRWEDTGAGAPALLLDFAASERNVGSKGNSASPLREVHLRIESPAAATAFLPEGRPVPLRPALVTAEQFRSAAVQQEAANGARDAPRFAARGGHLSAHGGGTNRAEARGSRSERGSSSLSAELGRAEGATFGVDLVEVGPHAVVGGTTGSGKSELLITWVLAMTAGRTTRQVQLLCFDFKGGATFDPLARLPHCVGIVTDLDPAEARRAATSLGSEMRARERQLRAARAKHIGELPGLARLVIVVDEYQALVDASAELQLVFSDISARGRSLGMHLILCAQQPAVAVRGSTLANCSVRVCLRVVSESDSTALLGNPGAAHLPAAAPGLALIAAGDRVQRVKVERRAPPEIERLIDAAGEREAHLGHPAPRPPWLPALPEVLSMDEVHQDERGLTFARADDTDAREQPLVRFEPALGAMVVIGAPRTGKSGCIDALVTAASCARPEPHCVIVMGTDPERAWDRLSEAEQTASRSLLVIDDVDLLLAVLEEPYRASFAERLLLLTRRAAAGSPAVVFSLSRATGGTSQLVAAAAQTLRLVGGERSSYVMAGGEASEHRADAPPGRAMWRGQLCQIARAPRPLGSLGSRDSEPAIVAQGIGDLFGTGATELLVVARRGATTRRSLERLGYTCIRLEDWRAEVAGRNGRGDSGTRASPERRAVIGDVEEWQAQFGLLARLSAEHPVLESGVTPNEHRMLFRGDRIPPLVVDSSRSAVLRAVDGTMRRVHWADADDAATDAAAPKL